MTNSTATRTVAVIGAIGALAVAGFAGYDAASADMDRLRGDLSLADEVIEQQRAEYDAAVEANRVNGGCEDGPMDAPRIIACGESAPEPELATIDA